MSTPLRWVHPNSYKSLQTLASQVGVHSYDYHVSVEDVADGQEIIIRRGDAEWRKTFDSADIARAAMCVTDFFEATVDDMAESAKQEYLDYMNNREV